MLYRNVLVSHSSCFVFCADKRFIQVLSEPEISAAYLYPGIQGFFYCINKIFLIDLHLINKLENQAVLLTEKSIQKMLLLHFLIAVFIGNLFQILNSLYGFLCKFTDIHRLSSSICKQKYHWLLLVLWTVTLLSCSSSCITYHILLAM